MRSDYHFMNPKSYEQINIKKESCWRKGKMINRKLRSKHKLL